MRFAGSGRKIGAALRYLSAAIATLVLGPALLVFLAQLDIDWARLSDIGQSYSGISAALSAVAFIAVAVGIRYQSKQLEVARHVSTLEAQRQLLDRALTDADLREVVGLDDGAELSEHEAKQFLYCTMWLRYYHTAFMIGDISADFLRGSLRGEYFTSIPARRHWERVRRHWLISWDQTKSHQRFVEIVESSYVRACWDAAARR